jgi:hypothetical protein
MYSVYVEDFMVRDVKYIWHGMSYGKLKEVLKENRNLRGFPLVDNPGQCSLYCECFLVLGRIHHATSPSS